MTTQKTEKAMIKKSRQLLLAGPSVPMATGIPRRRNSHTGATPDASLRLEAGQVMA